MKLRTLFIITAAFFAMNAPIALLFPMTQLSLYGVAAGPGASYMAQWAGLGSVAVALTAWFARNLANSEWRRGTRTHADDLLYSGLRYISAGCIFRSNERDGMVARGYLPVIRHWIRILSIEARQLLRFISCCQVKCYLMLRLNPLLERTGDSAIFTQPRCIIGVAGWPLPGLPAPGLQAQVVLRPSWAGSANVMPRMHAAPLIPSKPVLYNRNTFPSRSDRSMVAFTMMTTVKMPLTQRRSRLFSWRAEACRENVQRSWLSTFYSRRAC